MRIVDERDSRCIRPEDHAGGHEEWDRGKSEAPTRSSEKTRGEERAAHCDQRVTHASTPYDVTAKSGQILWAPHYDKAIVEYERALGAPGDDDITVLRNLKAAVDTTIGDSPAALDAD